MEYIVVQLYSGETWTRSTRAGAIGLADNIAKERRDIGIVRLDGNEIYRSSVCDLSLVGNP